VPPPICPALPQLRHCRSLRLPAAGTFVVGNKTASGHVDFWGSQWAINNKFVSGRPAPAGFKGFANTTAQPPACTAGWSTSTGNSPIQPSPAPSDDAIVRRPRFEQLA
jgi:hypothetical protein